MNKVEETNDETNFESDDLALLGHVFGLEDSTKKKEESLWDEEVREIFRQDIIDHLLGG